MIRNLLHGQSQDQIAVIEDKQCLTYRDLAQKAAAIQKELPQKRQTNIAIILPNSGDYIAALYGTIMAGMTAFPLNTQLTTHELAPLLGQADVHTVITSARYKSRIEELAGKLDDPPGVIYVEELEPDTEVRLQAANVGEDEPMILLSTSGTTGKAKIVQLSEKNVAATVFGFESYNDYEKVAESEIKYILGTPFPSVYGLLVLSTCLLKSFPIVIPEEAVTLDVLYRAAEKHKVTHYEGGAAVPIMMDQMSNRAIPYDISSLRFIGYGGSKVAEDVLLRLAKAFPDIDVCTGYGMTESAALIARAYKRLPEGKRAAVGIALPKVTIMIEAGGAITSAPHVTGEVVAKGPNVMLGYYGNEQETRKIIKDGYLYTGDIGYLDEEGYLYLCGRKKNVIMVRGFSVYAEEVESCIMASGLAGDCVVYGETDASGNEVLCANIVPGCARLHTDEIRAYCETHLAGYKQPQRLHIVDSIKKTTTGKPVRAT